MVCVFVRVPLYRHLEFWGTGGLVRASRLALGSEAVHDELAIECQEEAGCRTSGRVPN